MNSYDILYGMEYIDTDMIEKAAVYGKKRKIQGIIKSLSVACLALGIVITGINVQNALSVKNRNPAQRFGVFIVDPVIENPYRDDVGPFRKTFPKYMIDLANHDYISLVYGTAKNIEVVKETVFGITWYLTVFDIEIIRTIKNAPESGTIKAASVNSTKPLYPQVSLDILSNPTAFFLLYYEPGKKFMVGDTGINLYDYADYRVGNDHKADENGAWVYDKDYILFDDLQAFCEKAPIPEDYFIDMEVKDKIKQR